MIYFIPSNFDVEQHILEYPPQGIKHFSKDKLLYVLDLIISIPANNKDLKTYSGYVPLHAETLKDTIGDGYRELLSYLTETGVLEEYGQYIVKHKSRQFRFRKKYRQEFMAVKAGEKFANRRKKALVKRIRKELDKPENRHFNHLYDWYGDGKLSLDLEGAHKFLYNTMLKGKVRVKESTFENLRVRINSVNRSKRELKKATEAGQVIDTKETLTRKERVTQRFFSVLMAATRMAEGIYFFKIDPKAGRVHTSLSNLKKELRNFLTYDGKRLVEIDVKNSQPFFSLAILNEAFWRTGEEAVCRTVFNITYANDIHSTPVHKHPLTSYMPISFLQQRTEGLYTHNIYERLHNTSSLVMLRKLVGDINIDELNRYRELVISGRIYEHLLNNFIEKTGRDNLTRDDMKKVVFTILFSKNEEDMPEARSLKERNSKESRVLAKDIFRASFPTIYKVFEALKEGNNALLACLLQSIEADVILNKICERVKNERPDLTIYTIHDSLLTTEGNELYLKRVMEEEFAKSVGAVPNLTVKLLCPNNLEPKMAQAA